MTIHDDAVTTLTAWPATSEAAALSRKRTLELLTDGPVAMTRTHRRGHVTASALIVDPDGRLLLCLHGRMKMWMQLGGHCEIDDPTLAAAALREATEESGIAGLMIDPDPIDVDIHPVSCKTAEGRDAPATPTHHYDVRFLVRCPAGATEQVSEESEALGWFRTDELPSPLASGVLSQIEPALARLR
jgi:ADP-ribose pyrophosphatase YjhB (NUDIX family)